MGERDPVLNVAAAVAAGSRLLPVDCRFALADPGQGRRQYLAAHLPRATYADLEADLSDMSAAGGALGRHPLPQLPVLAAALRRWGWRPVQAILAYDAGSGAMTAARLWWLLTAVGIPAFVLDGGIAAWTRAGQPLEAGRVVRGGEPPALQLDASRAVLSAARLKAELEAGAVLVDARAAARYRGEQEPIDPVAGHVPGAVNRPFADNLAGDGGWKPAAQLRAEFAAIIGQADPRRVIHMCGSGVTACHNLLAMEHAGLHGSRLYAPSWSGWSSDAANPVRTGALP